ELSLLETLLPEALAMTGSGTGGNGRILGVLDRLAAEGRTLPDPTLFAALLLPAVRA
ncbi:MAG: hypothetical protein GTN45_00945, partial [Xanthomonadales bacterium]|nr:hypothetical protein [Xanthomonadales bacterium]